MTNAGSEPSLCLYWGSGSPFAWRAMLALELKGLPYASKLLEFSKGEHRSPEMMALNPRGKVPVLVDGDTVVYESLAVLAYLDRRFPVPPLFGATPKQAARVWRLVSEHESYVAGPARRIYRPVFMGQSEARADDIRAADDELHIELSRIEQELGDEPWLAGTLVGAADICYFVTLQLLRRAANKPEAEALGLGVRLLAERNPRLVAWSERFAALPGVDRTWPPHWT